MLGSDEGLDNGSTTPIAREMLDAMLPVSSGLTAQNKSAEALSFQSSPAVFSN
jgi:hypothetical protein